MLTLTTKPKVFSSSAVAHHLPVSDRNTQNRSRVLPDMPKSSSPRYSLGPSMSSTVIKCKRRRPLFVDLSPLNPPQPGQQVHPTKQQTIEKQFFSPVKRPSPRQKAMRQSLPTGPRLGESITARQESAASEKQRKSTVKPLVRFRRAVRTVLSLLKTFKRRESEEKKKEEPITWSDLEVRASRRAYQMFGLTWDPLTFRINKEGRAVSVCTLVTLLQLNISNEAKAILTSRPDMRTPEQLHVALLSLSQTMPAFSEYPKAMQVSLVKAGWYEFHAAAAAEIFFCCSVEAKRTIIRQGHKPFNFYLIISGTALVTAKEETEEGKVSHRTIAILKKGMSFGESCLFSGCRRIATVTSKDNMEVLVIARDDYIDIFHQDTSDGQDPEHISFLRSIRLFKDWPVSSLTLGDPSVCLYTYARRGTLLCKDAEEGEWIYVIKCGSCQVLKELTSVTPNWACSHKTWHHKVETTLGRSGDLQDRVSKRARDGPDFHLPPPSRQLALLDLPRRERTHLNASPTPLRRLNTFHHTSQADLQVTVSPSKKEVQSACNKHIQEQESVLLKRGPSSLAAGGKRSMEDTDRVEDCITKKKPAEEEGRCFVHILTLRPKDVYGLDHVVLPTLKTPTRTSLVSNGAECILISKKFFLKHLTDDCFRRIQTEIRPLPSDDALQEKLQTKTDWESYRAMAISDVIANKKHVSDSLRC